mgnify:CR=1 FL=1|jgi:hypothetical protein
MSLEVIPQPNLYNYDWNSFKMNYRITPTQIMNKTGFAQLMMSNLSKWSDFIVSVVFWIQFHLFSNIYLFVTIQKQFISKISGAYFIMLIAFSVNLSSKAGGSLIW